MTTATKTILAISIAGFIGGSVVDFGGFEVNPMLTVILPIGAIFFGVFLISLILEKEVAKFNDEQGRRLAPIKQPLDPKKPKKDL